MSKFWAQPNFKRLILSAVVCIIALYLNLVIGNLTVYRLNRNVKLPLPLADILFEWLPEWKSSDLVVLDLPYYLFLAFMFLSFLFHSKRVRVLTVFFTTTAIVYFMRVLTVSVTLMPPAKILPNRLDVGIKSLWWFNGSVSDLYGDSIFSGHISLATVAFFTFIKFMGGMKNIAATIPATLAWLYICFVVIFTRYQYTSAVFCALYISITVTNCVYIYSKRFKDVEANKENKTFDYITI